MTVNDNKARGCSLAPHLPASEEGRPERVPCAGNGNGTSLNNAGSNGNYWSSVPNSDNNNAWNLNFNSSNHNTNNNNRNNGQSVRPVQVFTAVPQGGVPHRGLLADLIVAYHDARRHKRSKFYQTNFEMNQERELVKLRDELVERRYVARPSSCFIIHDPKMREVFAAEFRDRVVHHLFYNYTHKFFERTFITYPSTKSLRRMRGRMKSLDWTAHPRRIQARVNSMLGVLSHYDCWHVRKVLTWEARLREFGNVTDDCLRFHPDILKFMVTI